MVIAFGSIAEKYTDLGYFPFNHFPSCQGYEKLVRIMTFNPMPEERIYYSAKKSKYIYLINNQAMILIYLDHCVAFSGTHYFCQIFDFLPFTF